MDRIVGIDLGTTNSLVAVVDSGIPLVIADAEGRRLTPSAVHFPADGSPPVVGSAALRLKALHPSTTLTSIKRFMGRRIEDLTEEETERGWLAKGHSKGPVAFDLNGRQITPEEVSAEVLKRLVAEAGRDLGFPVRRAVITVPAYFNDAQRQATKRAGELAGLTVERIVNEPTAAALAYGLNRLKDRSKIAVYDLGGGTFDLSILELTEGVFRVLATHGDTRLGGDDLDRRVASYLASEILKAGGPDISRDAMLSARVHEAAEAAKIRLSSEQETRVTLPFLTPTFSFELQFTRSRLEALTRDIIERTRSCCLRSLSDAGLESSALDQVVLVGGQTRMPLVRQLVSEWFGCAEFEETRGDLRLGDAYHKAAGPALNTSQNPDEAVALGAAIQAEILNGGFEKMLLLDVTPLSLGLETFGGLMNVIIPRNSTIPVKAGEVFTTAVDHQKSMLIHILQGEREKAADNWSLGRLELEFERAPRGVPRVGVQFEIDANGILHVLARDIRTGMEKVVQMASAVDVGDADVQKMVEESVEYAFEDLRARRWIEAKLRAVEVLEATRAAMQECGTLLPDELKPAITEAIATVEAALASESSETGAGDPARLTEAVKCLDEVTLPLADLVMDQAMETLVRKRMEQQGQSPD